MTSRSSSIADASDGALVMVGDMPEPVGGVAEVCVQVCTRLEREGIRVHFVDTEPNPVKRPPPMAGYVVFTPTGAATVVALRSPRTVAAFLRVLPRCLPALGLKRTLYVLLLAAEISGMLRRTGARVVVAHHAGTRGLAALVAARATGSRAIVMVHGAEFTHPGWRRNERVARYVVEHAGLVVTPSAFTRSLCTGATRRRDDVCVAYNGVDHERFNPGAQRPPTPAGNRIVLFVGHLHPRKGPTVLAEAIPLVTASSPATYVIVGPDMGEEARLRRIIESSGVADRVEIRGNVADDAMPGLYASADVFVFPTAWPTEGFGLVAAEAMACGTPVVASRIAAIPEVVIDGETGLLFEPGDAHDLADKLSRLLEDDELRARLGQAATRHAARFSWDSLTRVLADAVNAPSPVRRPSRRGSIVRRARSAR